METKVQSLVAEIEALSEAERQTLAQEILPLLLSTRAGLAEIDRSLEALSDVELSPRSVEAAAGAARGASTRAGSSHLTPYPDLHTILVCLAPEFTGR
jgi:Trp operon repressor